MHVQGLHQLLMLLRLGQSESYLTYEVIVCDAGLAASANVVGVSLGGILGHCMCTGGAVLGGRQMAAYVAERTLAVIILLKGSML